MQQPLVRTPSSILKRRANKENDVEVNNKEARKNRLRGRRVSFAPDEELETMHLYPKDRDKSISSPDDMELQNTEDIASRMPLAMQEMNILPPALSCNNQLKNLKPGSLIPEQPSLLAMLSPGAMLSPMSEMDLTNNNTSEMPQRAELGQENANPQYQQQPARLTLASSAVGPHHHRTHAQDFTANITSAIPALSTLVEEDEDFTMEESQAGSRPNDVLSVPPEDGVFGSQQHAPEQGPDGMTMSMDLTGAQSAGKEADMHQQQHTGSPDGIGFQSPVARPGAGRNLMANLDNTEHPGMPFGLGLPHGDLGTPTSPYVLEQMNMLGGGDGDGNASDDDLKNKWGFTPGADDTLDMSHGRRVMGDTTYNHVYGSSTMGDITLAMKGADPTTGKTHPSTRRLIAAAANAAAAANKQQQNAHPAPAVHHGASNVMGSGAQQATDDNKLGFMQPQHEFEARPAAPAVAAQPNLTGNAGFRAAMQNEMTLNLLADDMPTMPTGKMWGQTDNNSNNLGNINGNSGVANGKKLALPALGGGSNGASAGGGLGSLGLAGFGASNTGTLGLVGADHTLGQHTLGMGMGQTTALLAGPTPYLKGALAGANNMSGHGVAGLAVGNRTGILNINRTTHNFTAQLLADGTTTGGPLENFMNRMQQAKTPAPPLQQPQPAASQASGLQQTLPGQDVTTASSNMMPGGGFGTSAKDMTLGSVDFMGGLHNSQLGSAGFLGGDQHTLDDFAVPPELSDHLLAGNNNMNTQQPSPGPESQYQLQQQLTGQFMQSQQAGGAAGAGVAGTPSHHGTEDMQLATGTINNMNVLLSGSQPPLGSYCSQPAHMNVGMSQSQQNVMMGSQVQQSTAGGVLQPLGVPSLQGYNSQNMDHPVSGVFRHNGSQPQLHSQQQVFSGNARAAASPGLFRSGSQPVLQQGLAGNHTQMLIMSPAGNAMGLMMSPDVARDEGAQGIPHQEQYEQQQEEAPGPQAPPISFHDFLSLVDIRFLDDMRRRTSMIQPDMMMQPAGHAANRAALANLDVPEALELVHVRAMQSKIHNGFIAELADKVEQLQAKTQETEMALARANPPAFSEAQVCSPESLSALRQKMQQLKKVCRQRCLLAWKRQRLSQEQAVAAGLRDAVGTLEDQAQQLQSCLESLLKLEQDVEQATVATAARVAQLNEQTKTEQLGRDQDTVMLRRASELAAGNEDRQERLEQEELEAQAVQLKYEEALQQRMSLERRVQGLQGQAVLAATPDKTPASASMATPGGYATPGPVSKRSSSSNANNKRAAQIDKEAAALKQALHNLLISQNIQLDLRPQVNTAASNDQHTDSAATSQQLRQQQHMAFVVQNQLRLQATITCPSSQPATLPNSQSQSSMSPDDSEVAWKLEASAMSTASDLARGLLEGYKQASSQQGSMSSQLQAMTGTGRSSMHDRMRSVLRQLQSVCAMAEALDSCHMKCRALTRVQVQSVKGTVDLSKLDTGSGAADDMDVDEGVACNASTAQHVVVLTFAMASGTCFGRPCKLEIRLPCTQELLSTCCTDMNSMFSHCCTPSSSSTASSTQHATVQVVIPGDMRAELTGALCQVLQQRAGSEIDSSPLTMKSLCDVVVGWMKGGHTEARAGSASTKFSVSVHDNPLFA